MNALRWLDANGTLPCEIEVCDLGMDEATLAVAETLARGDGRISLLSAVRRTEEGEKLRTLEQQREMDRPKVVFAESVAVAKTSILVGEMAKLIKQATGTDIGQNRFFEYLRNHGYLHSFGSQKNLPTQRSMDAGWFEIKEGTRLNSDGVSVITRPPQITGKGPVYLISLISK